MSGLRRTTGVVLAGGRSRRFGSSDKLTASYGGEPMLHRSVRVLADLGAEVIVVLAPDVAEPSVPSGVQARFVRDTVRGQGPLAGVVAGLREVDSETALVVAGDMPELQVPVLRSMLRTLNEPGAEAVWLHDGDRPRPVPLAVRTAPALSAAQRLFAAGERRLRALPEALGARVLEEAVWTALDPDRRTLLDVDVPEDLPEESVASGSPGAMATSHPTLRVGEIEVTVLCEGVAGLPLAEECPGREVAWPAARKAHPWAFLDDAHWAWHVHAFLLRTSVGDVLVDTGVGSFGPWMPWATPSPRAPWAAVDPDRVRNVVLTHLHADHAGGTVEPDGTRRFPNARYHAHPADWEHFEANPVIRDSDGQRYDARDAMAGLAETRVLSLDPEDHEVSPGVRLLHAPGHTPGHRVVLVGEGAEALMLSGDLLHMPLQVGHPDWESSHDEEPEAACRSRAAMLDRADREAMTVAVSHFARPFGLVSGGGWTALPPARTLG